ncbi:hypothetical protein EV361DRAFT_62313 [Lentinula raphanica]|nr:hypothetical protein EV361DRAFT_62313 [Lentinula raphanica]
MIVQHGFPSHTAISGRNLERCIDDRHSSVFQVFPTLHPIPSPSPLTVMKLIYTKVKGKRVSSGPEGERATAGPGGTGITDRSSQPSRPSAKPSTNSICWDLSEQVLSTLATAAQFAPVPYLDNVSALALSIFKGVQGAKENQEALGELSKTAIQLALLV